MNKDFLVNVRLYFCTLDRTFVSEMWNLNFYLNFPVLHLGNVYFHRKQLKHGQEGVEIGSDAEIRWTGHLLRLDADGIKQALTTKTTVRIMLFVLVSYFDYYYLYLYDQLCCSKVSFSFELLSHEFK